MAEYVMEYDGWAEGIPVGEYLKVRDAMHARKREEVVRCRDCRFCGRGMWGVETFPVCRRRHTFQVSYDGFCAWGKRRESE